VTEIDACELLPILIVVGLTRLEQRHVGGSLNTVDMVASDRSNSTPKGEREREREPTSSVVLQDSPYNHLDEPLRNQQQIVTLEELDESYRQAINQSASRTTAAAYASERRSELDTMNAVCRRGLLQTSGMSIAIVNHVQQLLHL